jgi:PAS domain S-box-containing protein
MLNEQKPNQESSFVMSNNYRDKVILENLDLHFRSIAGNIPQIFSFIDPETFTIKYINRVEEGYDLKEVIGKEIFNYLLPDQCEPYRIKIEQVKRSGKTEQIEAGFQSFAAEGGISWFLTTISPVCNAEGELESILVLSENITENKRLEIENQNRSERLKAIINNNNDLICSIDTDYCLIEFNNTLADAIKAEKNIDLGQGMLLLNFLAPHQRKRHLEIYERVKQGEICHDIEEFSASGSEKRFLETSFHPIYGINNEFTGISIFSRNITERVKNEKKIRDALREKETMLSEIHHRIKNNLAMISSMLQLQELTIPNEGVREALSGSRKRIKATALIHEMLYKEDTFNKISLKEFISQLFNLLRTGDEFRIEVNGEDRVFNLTSALPLGLILNELMTNSFKYSYNNSSKGKTVIVIHSDGDLLTIMYRDEFGSFPSEVNFKTSNTTGLTLIHTFAQQLSGSIDLISSEPPEYKIQIKVNENN